MKKLLSFIGIFVGYFLIYATTNIIFWHSFNGPFEKKLQNIVNQYNKQQNQYKVILKYCGNYRQLQNKLIQSSKFQNVLPDIFIGYSDWITKIGSDKLYRVDKILSETILKKINKELLKDAQYNHIQYGVPFNKSIMLMYVNMDILNKIGIDINKYSIENFYQLLEDIHSKTGKAAFATNLSTWFFENYLVNMGGNLRNLNSDIGNKIINIINKAFRNKLLIVKTGYTFQDYWVNQDIPIIFTSIVSIKFLEKRLHFKYKREKFLHKKNSKTKEVLAGANIFIANNKNHIKAIKDFLNWLYSSDRLDQWFSSTQYLPIYEELKNGKYLKDCQIILEPHDKNWFEKRRKLSQLLKKAILYQQLPQNYLDLLDE